jgi:hypothetical protein
MRNAGQPPAKRRSCGMGPPAIFAVWTGVHGCGAIARVGRANRVAARSADFAQAHLEAAHAAAFIVIIAAPEPCAPRPFRGMARRRPNDGRRREYRKDDNDSHRASPVYAWPRRNAQARNRVPDGSGGPHAVRFPGAGRDQSVAMEAMNSRRTKYADEGWAARAVRGRGGPALGALVERGTPGGKLKMG